MKLNSGFQSWNEPYLFKSIEEYLNSISETQRKDLIPMGIGDPDLPTPIAIREAICREHRNRYYGYPTVEGRRDLREALAEYYLSRFSVAISPDHIMVGMGAKTDLFDIPAVFSNPGDTIAILDPAYPVYRDAARFRGAKILYLQGSPDNGYQPVLDEKKLKDDPLAIIFMCYPNNPTGALASREYVTSMIEIAHRCNSIIVFDIAYADFLPGDKKPSSFSVFSLPGADEVCIEVGSFSKPFSMTGDRISWVVSKNRSILDVWRRYRSNRDSGASCFDQAGAIAALTDPSVAHDVKRNMMIYGDRAEFFVKTFEAKGIKITSLENSPYCWFPCGHIDSKKYSMDVLQKAHVLLTPGIGFGPGGEGYVRATIFQPLEKIKTALERLFTMDLSN